MFAERAERHAGGACSTPRALVVHTVLNLSADLLELPDGQLVRDHELTARAIKQIRLIFLGASQWRPDRGTVDPVAL